MGLLPTVILERCSKVLWDVLRVITGKIDKGTAYDPDASLSFALEIVSVSNPILKRYSSAQEERSSFV